MDIQYLLKAFENEDIFQIKKYILFYEIDLKKKLFRSEQKITIKNCSNEMIENIEAIIHECLVIDSITVENIVTGKLINNELTISRFEDQFIRQEGLEGVKYQLIKIKLEQPIMTDQELLIHVNLHMLPEDIQNREPKFMWSFVVNPLVSYAVEPCTGHYFRVLLGEPSAPFELTIKYPEGNHSCVPGSLESSERVNGFIIDHYSCKIPNIPAFSVAPYQKLTKRKDGLNIEFYVYSGVVVDENLYHSLFKIVQLYQKYFGDNGTSTYKFATVGAHDSVIGGAENKGNVIYFDTKFMNEPFMLGICVHEIFHNWNLFFVYFSGELFEWFSEGGANFIAAWAMENVISEEIGAMARKFYVNSCIQAEKFITGKSLLIFDKLGEMSEYSALIYYYGALVWEQLRQKIGDDAFFEGLKHFFRDFGYNNANYKDLFSCLENETSVNVKDYLDPWINQVPKIDITITAVDSIENGNDFLTRVRIEVKSEKDLEIKTDIGYRTSPNGELFVKTVTFVKKGMQVIEFKSPNKPIFVQIDPFYRVPQMNIENCSWKNNGDS